MSADLMSVLNEPFPLSPPIYLRNNFEERRNDIKKLANHIESSYFIQEFVNAYIEDTQFIKRNVIKREIETPAALLNLIHNTVQYETNTLPLGKVAILVPKNSLGLTLAKAIASSYLMGNHTIVYLPSQLQRTAPIYQRLLTTFLPGTDVIFASQSSKEFLQHSFQDPKIKAIVIYGDDQWIDSYWPLAASTGTKLIFEGPGNDPMIVMPDANIEKTIAAAIEGGLNNGGQSCSAFERFFIHNDIAEIFCQKLIKKLQNLQSGPPQNIETEIGPIASNKIFEKIQYQLQSAIKQGAQLLYGGEVVYCSKTKLPIIIPAVLTQCNPEMAVVDQETFGPIFPIITFSDVSTLIPSLDATQYGLNAAVFGSCPDELYSYLDQCHRNVYLNSTPVSAENINSRIIDGGYRRSGFIWEQQDKYVTREGKRLLTNELCKRYSISRIEPLPMSQMREEWISTLKQIPGDGLKGIYAPTHVLGTLMHNPDTLGSFLEYWVTSKLKMGFSVREQEIIILRMGFLYQCNYVWKHHVPVALEFGVSKDEINAIKKESIKTIFNEREYALLKITDELVERRTLSQTFWNQYSHLLTKSEWVDIISLVSQYVLFALTNNVMQVQIEDSLKNIEGL